MIALSAKESKVIALAAEGYGSKETATVMQTTVNYVKNLRASAFIKLGADNIAQAVAMAMRRKLID